MKYSHKNTGNRNNEQSGTFSGKENFRKVKQKEFPENNNSSFEKLITGIAETELHGDIDVDSAWNNVFSRINYPVRTLRNKRAATVSFMRIAAAIFLAVSLGALIYYFGISNPYGKIVVSTENTEPNREVILPDGSRVWLNHDSRLIYPAGFGSKSRTVKLTGEGFFEVVKGNDKPFSVDAGKAIITVTGTSFNVITSNDSGEVEVFVNDGNVVVSGDGFESIMLDPGYVGITGKNTITRSFNTNRNYLAWRTGLLVYENTRLYDVFSDLKRVYGISVNTADSSIYEKTLTATFDRESQETIIRIICTTFNLSYVKEGNRFLLSSK